MAVAQKSQDRPPEKSAGEIADVKQRVADWLKTCLTDWDRENSHDEIGVEHNV